MTALYGGTFNPVHVGHLHVAITVCEQLALPQIRLVLSARPPHRDPVPVEHRWRMLELGCAIDSRLQPDNREVLRESASFTLDTLANERRRHPSKPLYWVIGMDSLLTFTSWYRWWRILDLAHLVVVRRPGYALQLGPPMRSVVQRRGWVASGSQRQPPGVAGRIVLLEEPMLRVSSSDIRAQISGTPVTAGGRVTGVVPAVADYILEHRLYTELVN